MGICIYRSSDSRRRQREASPRRKMGVALAKGDLTHPFLHCPSGKRAFSCQSTGLCNYCLQGITVPRAVLNITTRDFAPGLTYVTVSRVKTLKLNGLSTLTVSVDRRSSGLAKTRQADLDRRRRQHELHLSYRILSNRVEEYKEYFSTQRLVTICQR
jgi:hypothetical protein